MVTGNLNRAISRNTANSINWNPNNRIGLETLFLMPFCMEKCLSIQSACGMVDELRLLDYYGCEILESLRWSFYLFIVHWNTLCKENLHC